MMQHKVIIQDKNSICSCSILHKKYFIWAQMINICGEIPSSSTRPQGEASVQGFDKSKDPGNKVL